VFSIDNCGIYTCISSTLRKGFVVAFISVRGAQEHNLKNIDVDIPKNSLVSFTGVSGSGKSSLVFDTIYSEAFRRFVDSSQTPIYVMGSSSWSKMSRPRFRSITGLPPALGLSQKQGVAGKLSTVGTISGISDLFRVYFAAFGDIFCHKCDIPLKSISFSDLYKKISEDFHSKKIMIIAPICEKRKGAFIDEIEKFKELGFSKLRVNGDIFDLQDENIKIKIDPKKLNTIDVIIDYVSILIEKKQRIERALFQALDYGKGIVKVEYLSKEFKFNTKSNCPQCGESAPKLDPRYFSHSSLGKCIKCEGEGSFKKGYPADIFPCKQCHGGRLDPSNPIIRVKGKTFIETHLYNINELYQFIISDFKEHVQNDKSKLKVYSEISRALLSMNRLGLGHLILNRSGASLSPGDLQRLRLSTMISNKLTGVLYIIDEPCQGLTKQEVKQLASVLQEIVKDGATVISVEHHPVFLSFCEILFLMGPGAGVHGGQVVAKATALQDLDEFVENPQTKLNKTKFAPQSLMMEKAPKLPKANSKKKSPESFSPKTSILSKSSMLFSDFQVRNLIGQKIQINQGVITIIRGASGVGKSSFIELCLLPALYSLGGKNPDAEDEIEIPFKEFCKFNVTNDFEVNVVGYVKPGSVTRSSRRSVASALDVIKPLRELFTKLPTSQVMGLTESHFSWNSKLGRCDHCEGKGYIELPQRYSEPVRVECEVCIGAKLNSRSLLPRFKGYNLADVMNFTLEQSLEIFENHKIIANRIIRACQFGLGYIQLGQGMDSLSGGELQRLNLTIELKRSNLEGAWFILTHPSTGLHGPDISILGELMKVMTERGATFILIENREEFLPFADKVIEF
jgi:excinuclease ABC subunit A